MNILITILCFLAIAKSYAATEQKNGYLIQTTLTFKNSLKNNISTSKDFILPADNKMWVTLTDMKDGVVLLGRAVKADSQMIQMEYLLIDGTEKPNGVVSAPSITTMFNESASISIGETGKDPTVRISMVAKKTEFTSSQK